MNFKKIVRGPIPWIVLAFVIIGTALMFITTPQFQPVPTNVGMKMIEDGKVKEALIVDIEQRVDLVLTEPDKEYGERVQFYYVEPRGDDVIAAIDEAAPKEGYSDEVPQGNWFLSMLGIMLPVLLLVVLFYFVMSRMSGGGRGVMQFGKSKAKAVNKDMPQVKFADVAGADEAVEELGEIKEFLEDPEKFQAVGAKIPKGVLLYGPPGTGKTLLARAVAGEAGVPFYSISGSDFVEMFVGVGASRVRDLFEQAKQSAPAIIFVDEIDAVGRQRGAGVGGGHDEREQTLNQLLVEMDGFDVKTNVILIAATNRPDILDPALLRPGRFDRQIGVDAPDMQGRRKILEVHAKGKPVDKSVDLDVLARKTPGYTGADLANVLNEAALLTARANEKVITDAVLDEAVDRVMAGPQRRTRVMNDKERLITAYHEGGHALAAAAMNHSDPVTKVTILPRGRALGYTMVVPVNDRYSVTRNELLDQMTYAMGGRVAEELVFHDPTTGASNDIEKATGIARKMVTEYGMTSAIGSVRLNSNQNEVFGREMSGGRDYSESISEKVDAAVRELVEQAHDEAWQVLNDNRDVLDELARQLLERETLDHVALAEVFKNVRKLPRRPQWLSSPERPVSDVPPVELPVSQDVSEAVGPDKVEPQSPADEAQSQQGPTE